MCLVSIFSCFLLCDNANLFCVFVILFQRRRLFSALIVSMHTISCERHNTEKQRNVKMKKNFYIAFEELNKQMDKFCVSFLKLL